MNELLFLLQSTGEPHTVIQYQFLAWKSGVVPESTIALFTLVDVVLANNATTSSPLLVHCSGGGDRSSVFVAFASLVKQLRLEERLDIFQTARYTRSQRQCMLKTIVSTLGDHLSRQYCHLELFAGSVRLSLPLHHRLH